MSDIEDLLNQVNQIVEIRRGMPEPAGKNFNVFSILDLELYISAV